MSKKHNPKGKPSDTAKDCSYTIIPAGHGKFILRIVEGDRTQTYAPTKNDLVLSRLAEILKKETETTDVSPLAPHT